MSPGCMRRTYGARPHVVYWDAWLPLRRKGAIFGEPARKPIEPDEVGPGLTRPHHRELLTLHQHFRHEEPRIVGRGHGRAVGARRHEGEKIARREGRQQAIECQIVTSLAD